MRRRQLAGLVDAHREARERAERLVDRLRHMCDIAQSLAAPTSLGDAGSTVLREAMHAVGAIAGWVGVLSIQGDRIEMVASRGMPDELVPLLRSVPADGDDPVADCVRRGEAVMLGSQDERDRRYPGGQDVLAAAGLDRDPMEDVGSMLAIPLRTGERAVGALVVMWPRERSVTSDENSFLTTLAVQFALALERARLLDAERTARHNAELAQRRLAFLSRLGKVLPEAVDMTELMGVAAKTATLYMADGCAIRMAHAAGGMVGVAVAHVDPGKRDLLRTLAAIPVESEDDLQGPVTSAVRGGEPVLVPLVTEETWAAPTGGGHMLEVSEQLEIASLMSVPIVVGGQVLGVVTLIRENRHVPYDEDDLYIAEAFAARIAVSAQNRMLMDVLMEREIALLSGGLWAQHAGGAPGTTGPAQDEPAGTAPSDEAKVDEPPPSPATNGEASR